MIRNKIKNKFFVLFIVSMLLSQIMVNGEVLVEIEVGDDWSYIIKNDVKQLNDVSLLLSDDTTIIYNVTSRKFLGSVEQIPINIITQNNYDIENGLILEIINKEFFVSANTNISLSNFIITNIVTNGYTARGNLPFEYKVTGTVDLKYNSTKIDNLSIMFYRTFSNIEIIKTISTGYAYETMEYYNVFINGSVTKDTILELRLLIKIKERFYSTNSFVYDNQECKNITIETLYIKQENHFSIKNDSYNFLSFFNIQITLERNENWVYSFDVGLPLLIERTFSNSLINTTNNNNQIKTLYDTVTNELEYIYILNYYDIKNSDYIKTTETSYYLFNLLSLMIIYVCFYFHKKRK